MKLLIVAALISVINCQREQIKDVVDCVSQETTEQLSNIVEDCSDIDITDAGVSCYFFLVNAYNN